MKGLVAQFKAHFEKLAVDMPASKLFSTSVFWCVVVFSILILGFTSYHVQSIPVHIESEINDVLVKRPWTRDFVVVDGRDVYLRGEIEPESGIEQEIKLISGISGVRSVSNVLEEIPKPDPYLNMRFNNNSLVLSGQLDGVSLENLVGQIDRIYPDVAVQDRITIDDRLGHPIWLEGFQHSISHLQGLNDFEINGWRNLIELNGTAESREQGRLAGYSFPASLVQGVSVINRITEKSGAEWPDILLISDWRGLHLSGTVPNEFIRDRLTENVRQTLGPNSVSPGLNVDSRVGVNGQLEELADLIATLGEVRNLRLQSSGEGYSIWGRVDQPETLGKILHQRNLLGLETVVENRIDVAKAPREAAVTLFSDGTNAVVSGYLPSIKSKLAVLEPVQRILNVKQITDLISIQPNIAHSQWLKSWEALIHEMPKSAMGITVFDNSILVTGNTVSGDQVEQIDRRLAILFPDTNLFNWVTAQTP